MIPLAIVQPLRSFVHRHVARKAQADRVSCPLANTSFFSDAFH